MADESLPNLEDKLRIVRKGILRREVFFHRFFSFCRRNPGWLLLFAGVSLIVLWFAFSVFYQLATLYLLS